MADYKTVKDYLDEKGINYELIELDANAFTVEDVIASGKATAEEVVKTLVIKTKDGFVAVCCRGGDRVDFKKLKEKLGKCQMANPEEVKEAVGVEIGAVCPIKIGLPILVDEKVLKNVKVNLGSGDHLKGINLFREDFLNALENYEVIKITQQ